MSTVMPVQPTWTTGSTEVFKTGTWRAALPRHQRAPSPCHQACPVNGDIAEWIGLARAGQLRAAWDVLVRHNPFPAVAGRICHHPCESACNRGTYDAAVSICRLERHVGDAAIAHGWQHVPPALEREGHVAVVGAGPAGLSAAYQLRRRGWRVTLYESTAAPGGLMRHGIPPYRLARDVLDAEIARIVALGVELRCNAPLASADDFARLRAAHDAVFVAVGAARPRRLPALDYTQPWVIDGAAYLAASNAGHPPKLGHRIVVIGGGSAAMDAARSARRAGHAVTLLALEERARLPAQAEELAEALDEGIALVDGAMLQRAAPQGDGSLRLACTRVRDAGSARFEPIDGGGFEFDADAIIVSIGQDPDLAPFAGALPAAPRGGVLDADAATQVTPAPGVWAGGDAASAVARHVTDAIGMGKRAALAIHAALGGAPDADADARAAADARPVVTPAAIATWYHVGTPRAAARTLAPAVRIADGAEVQLPLDVAQALAESERCWSCGTCIDCDNCIVVCPDLAVRRAPAGADAAYEVLADYCKGCGLCVRECPTGSIAMHEEVR